MPVNPAFLDRTSFEAVQDGFRVERAASNLPQTADMALFHITGRVRLKQIIGEVTTVIQTQANNTKLKYNPTGAGNDTDLCAVLNISADAVGTYYGITGTVGDAMIEGIRMVKEQAAGLILEDGDIELDCAASNTGQIAWTVIYTTVEDGASIVAA